MRLLGLIIILISAAPFAAGQESDGWKKFTSAEGHFSVMLPETPNSDSIPINHPSGITFIMNVFIIPGDDKDVATYMIMYMDYPVDLDDTEQERVLDAARDGAINRNKATLTSEKKITLNGYAGRAFEATKEIGAVQFRIFLVGRRLYTVAYGWNKTADPAWAAKNASKYFDSFKLDLPKV